MQKQQQPTSQTRPVVSIANPITRIALVLGGVLGLANGARMWNEGAVFIHTEMMTFSMASYILGFLSLVGAAGYTERYRRLAHYFLLFIYLVSAVGLGYNNIRYLNPGYGTDAVAFNHYSAELCINGKNPYSQSMQGSFERFNMEQKLHTVDVEGKKIDKLSYPALSFLLYTPFIALGVDNVNWVHLLAHLVALLLLFFFSPDWLRPIVPLVMFLDLEFIHFSTGGVTDVMFLPFLILTVCFWRKNKLWAALFWAAACCVKQQPWFLAPFMAVAIINEQFSTGPRAVVKQLGRYFLPAAGLFLVINLPFIIGSPKGWFTSIFTPLGKPLIMYGAGLVNLTTGGGVGAPRLIYTLLALATLVALLCAYYLFYENIKAAMWVMPGMILWMAPRSLTSYFIYWAPLVALAVAYELDETFRSGGDGTNFREGNGGEERGTKDDSVLENCVVEESEIDPDGTAGTSPGITEKINSSGLVGFVAVMRRHAGLAWMIALPLVAFSTVAVAALFYPGNVQTRVVRAVDVQKLGVVNRADVRVTNNTKQSFVPRFAMHTTGNNLYFWQTDKERKRESHYERINPGETKQYRVFAKSPLEAPRIDQQFRFRIYGPPNGRFFLSAPFGPINRTALIHNADLAVWEKGRRAPLSWKRSLHDPDSMVHQKEIMERKAVCLALRQDGTTSWQRVWIGQKMPARVQSVSFFYYAKQDPVGLYRPLQLMGLELEFPGGRVAVVAPSRKTPIPLVSVQRKMLFVHLPYNRVGWQRFSVSVSDLWKHFGYHQPVPFQMRLFLSRHASLKGSVTACYSNTYASSVIKKNDYRLGADSPINNPRFNFWKKGASAPLGWKLERPREKTGWQIARIRSKEHHLDKGNAPDSEKNTPDTLVSLMVKRKQGTGASWKRLALSQDVVGSAQHLVFRVCSQQMTQNLEEPKLLIGVEIVEYGTNGDQRIHVYTLATENRIVRIGSTYIRGIKHTGGCTDIDVDLAKIKVRNPGVRLFVNIHRKLEGEYGAVFHPLRWHHAE